MKDIEAIQPPDPFTFSACHPERPFAGFDVSLIKKWLKINKNDKTQSHYDKIRFDQYQKLMCKI